MAASSIKNAVQQIFLPKGKQKAGGSSYTNTYNPSATTSILALPAYRDHLTDIFTSRQSSDSRDLLKGLFKYDSDVSAALHAYLTVANTEPRFYVYDAQGQLDQNGLQILDGLLTGLTRRNDYTTGFSFTKSFREVAEDCRYMALLRGGIGAELVFNKLLIPSEVRQIDLATIEFFEITPGVFKPQQRTVGTTTPLQLDLPTIFMKFYRQNPTEAYTESMFVSAINTIAARQQVINDLYRIMTITGYPRIEVSVAEEVLRKNAPASVRADEVAMSKWVSARMNEISTQLGNLRADSAFVHTDSVEAKILNDKGPGASLDVSQIINVLNSQNQAALKVVGTVIGKGETGVNTASVEARIFAMAADSLNGPIADLFSEMLTLAIRLSGYEGYVECCFDKVELRPWTELEPQLIMRQTRLKQDLSDGLITDDEYHMEMYGRPRPPSAPELSGTHFLIAQAGTPDVTGVSPNADPLGRSITPPGSKTAQSNTVKKTTTPVKK